MEIVEWVVDDEGQWTCVVAEHAWWRLLVRKVIDLGCPKGRHWLCSPPSWALEIGRPWRPWPEEKLNLGNLWWAAGFWLLNHPAPAKVLVSLAVDHDQLPARHRPR